MTAAPTPGLASARWQQFADDDPDLARLVRARFEATKHHVLATLRRGGSPRVSGTEVQFHGPDLVVGMMHGSVKARDLQRDGRFALHANPGDGSMEGGDAKVSGLAVEVTDPVKIAAYVEAVGAPEPLHLFRLEITDVVHTAVAGDRLAIATWRPGTGTTRTERA